MQGLDSYEDLKYRQLSSITKMIVYNADTQKMNFQELSKSRLIEMTENNLMHCDTLLRIYLDFVRFLTPDQLAKFKSFREDNIIQDL